MQRCERRGCASASTCPRSRRTTKIRAKYLRALENEEWDLLPGPTFVKSFLRTYAHALGLDGKALVEEYRLNYERPSEPPEPIVSAPRKVRVPRGSGGVSGRPGPSRGYMALVGIVVIVIVLLIVGLVSGGGGSSTTTAARAAVDHAKHSGAGGGAHRSRIERRRLASRIWRRCKLSRRAKCTCA